MIEGAIYQDGKVVVRYYQPIPKLVRVGGEDYMTSVQHGVSLVFIDEQNVPAFLAYLGGCCGGKRRVFSLCSQEAYNVYRTGNR